MLTTKFKKLIKFTISLLLISLLAGCGTKNNCNHVFPFPSDNVQNQIDKLAEQDREVWEWWNKIFYLCEDIGTCGD